MPLDLSNLYISQSFQRVLQISDADNRTILDGTGSYHELNFSGSFSGSFRGDGSGLTGYATNFSASWAHTALSASHEIIKEISSSHANYADNAGTASFALTSGAVTGGGSTVWKDSGTVATSSKDIQITGSLIVSGSTFTVDSPTLTIDSVGTISGSSTSTGSFGHVETPYVHIGDSHGYKTQPFDQKPLLLISSNANNGPVFAGYDTAWQNLYYLHNTYDGASLGAYSTSISNSGNRLTFETFNIGRMSIGDDGDIGIGPINRGTSSILLPSGSGLAISGSDSAPIFRVTNNTAPVSSNQDLFIIDGRGYIQSTANWNITGSLAQGFDNIASGDYSTAGGSGTIASGERSHAEGKLTIAPGDESHAEGYATSASGDYSHAEGFLSKASAQGSHAEGASTISSGNFSHSEGYLTIASGTTSHAEGIQSKAIGLYSHAEGHYTSASGDYAHAEGSTTIASGSYSHAEGSQTSASGDYAHAEGRITNAGGNYSHAEGVNTKASNLYSHAEGGTTEASGVGAHTEGASTIAAGNYSHAEGYATKASNLYSHAEGGITIASGTGAHAEGLNSLASGNYSHAEGLFTTASGNFSHAEGSGSIAYGIASHAAGIHTIASGSGQTTVGQYNTHGNTDSLFVIGDGTAAGARSDLALFNANSITLNGHVTASGNISGSGLLYISASLNPAQPYKVLVQDTSTGRVYYTGSYSTGGGGGGSTFPFVGDAVITGSLTISGSFHAFTLDADDVVLGSGAGALLQAGPVTNNVLIGVNAGAPLTTGKDNVAIGWHAGYTMGANITNGVMIGREAGINNKGTANVGIGYAAYRNASGFSSGGNVAIGQNAIYGRGGQDTIAIGNSALGNNASAATAPNFTIAIGGEAGYSIAGTNNIFLGYKAGKFVTSGTYNILIGDEVNTSAPAASNELKIGKGSVIPISASLTTGDVLFPSTASAAYFSGDGSKLTNLPAGGASGLWSGSAASMYTGDGALVYVSGSLIVSQSYTAGDSDSTALKLIGSGSVSGSGIFEVIGSVGTVFSVNDGLTGTLFEANNISGLPVIQAKSDNTVHLGKWGGYGITISGSTPDPTNEAAIINIIGNTRITGSLSVTGSINIQGSAAFKLVEQEYTAGGQSYSIPVDTRFYVASGSNTIAGTAAAELPDATTTAVGTVYDILNITAYLTLVVSSSVAGQCYRSSVDDKVDAFLPLGGNGTSLSVVNTGKLWLPWNKNY